MMRWRKAQCGLILLTKDLQSSLSFPEVYKYSKDFLIHQGIVSKLLSIPPSQSLPTITKHQTWAYLRWQMMQLTSYRDYLRETNTMGRLSFLNVPLGSFCKSSKINVSTLIPGTLFIHPESKSNTSVVLLEQQMTLLRFIIYTHGLCTKKSLPSGLDLYKIPSHTVYISVDQSEWT